MTYGQTPALLIEKYKSDYEMQQELNELGKNPN